jgi:hypothetical protein
MTRLHRLAITHTDYTPAQKMNGSCTNGAGTANLARQTEQSTYEDDAINYVTRRYQSKTLSVDISMNW